ncbi:hypothetical protein O6H91_22G038300 [Diphasiastrum complanatum]|uniref:Uncharacterized protein n=2 Tax=Diphasiastrum complanatum TaxID=34168 RepID=A0ACC2AEV7_DIPCM|nr:hypothetical protein O6H91_22G037700 [Diphasiastrum complanatum]KAJ7516006.1 hypothetical protein O6H91_22G038300 [Diphasiastrum complanatum]
MELITEESTGSGSGNEQSLYILEESHFVCREDDSATEESNTVQDNFGTDRSMKVLGHERCEDEDEDGSSLEENVVDDRLSENLAGMNQIIDNENDHTIISSLDIPAEGFGDSNFLKLPVGQVIIEAENGVLKPDNNSTQNCSKGMDASADCGVPSTLACSSNSCPECLNLMETHSEVLPVYSQSPSGFESISQNPVSGSEEHVQLGAELVSSQDVVSMEAQTLQTSNIRKVGRAFFFYELPLPEETGSWIPVSVPPMEAEDFERSLYEDGVYGGGYFPEFSSWPEGSDQQPCTEIKDRVHSRTMLYGILEAVFGKGKALVETIELVWNRPQAPVRYCNDTGLFKKLPKLIDEANSLRMPAFSCDAGQDVHTTKEVLEAEPPEWIPDSAASSCLLCGSSFRPFTCARHHCRFCGGIFCNDCSTGRCLLPARFRERDPQRVCDTCWHRLEPTQRILADQVSNAAQIATRDVTDYSCLRAWLNNPLGISMEQEIFKATNTLRSYYKMGLLAPEKSIPEAVLRGARGLAIITVVKIGMMMTYKIGTGLVVARRVDGTWSAPSAIASCGIGWGLQAGGELTDFIIVLRTAEAVRAFAGCVHLSVGASLSAAAGPVGRAAEADIRAGDGGAAACYTYSRSKGAFIGCSLESNVVATRYTTNTRFYGDSCITTGDILLGPVSRPKAAAPLYCALSDLFLKVEAFSAL